MSLRTSDAIASPAEGTIRMAAIGDLLLTARPGDSNARGLGALADDVRELFASCDLVLANLECTMPGTKTVPTEPLVLTTEQQIRSLDDAGINLVTLGNNHTFDCFDEGYLKTTDLLSSLDIPWFGAGRNLADATCPLILERKGVSFGFLGAVDASSGPHRFADETCSGVAPLNMNELCASIRRLRQHVDHVVVSVHWGSERYRIPSPQQIDQARQMVDDGASMIVGHHPHVLQGMEVYRDAPIAYSLGNFLANNVYWQNGDELTWSRFERTGVILLAEFNSNGFLNVQQVPVFDDGKTISIARSGTGDRYLEKVNGLLRKGVTERRFRRETLYVEVVKPVIANLRWSKLKRIRISHFGKLWKLLTQ